MKPTPSTYKERDPINTLPNKAVVEPKIYFRSRTLI